MKFMLLWTLVFAFGFCGLAQAGDACLWVKVAVAVDGDTLRLHNGDWVRCAAIDTPEIDHKNHCADPLGYEARAFLNLKVKGKRICLKSGKRYKDRYGRIIAYLFDQQGAMINDAIVARGLGHVYPHPGEDPVYAKKLLETQHQAMRQHLGIWRHRLETKGAFTGNRRSKRFHVPECPSAKRIRRKNRKIFPSIRDAYWEGYAPAAGCLGSTLKKPKQR